MNTTENNKLIGEFMGLNLLNSIINPVSLKESQIVIGRKYIDTKEGKIFECTKTAFPLVIVQDNENGYHCANIKNCKEIYFNKELQYNSSWDWLMPVIYKITRLGISWSDEGTRLFLKIGDCLCLINLEATYNAVVDVIKWYNEQKQ